MSAPEPPEVFREPWEAQSFAMVMALYERGLFTWPEWAAVLSAEIARAQAAGDPDLGDTDYHHWQNEIERIGAEFRQYLERYFFFAHRERDRPSPVAKSPDD